MVVISKTILNAFGKAHPDAVVALDAWYVTVCQADWQSFSDIKQTFNSVDYVRNERFVFNIKGNQYRLVAMIFFDKRTLFVRFIGTHREYDKIDCATI